MAWLISISDTARRQLKKLDQQTQRKILDYLEKHIETDEDPCRFGSALQGSLAGLWRYRVGDYRIICEIKKEELVVLVLRAAHRRKVYGGH